MMSLSSSLLNSFNSVILITDKFIKCTAFISDKITYNTEKWAHLLLEHLELAD